MLDREAVVKLKRSASEGDHLIPMGEVTPPPPLAKKTSISKTRSGRSFSWSKLTDSIKGRRNSSSRSSRSSRTPPIDKREISGPILDLKSPLCPPTPKSGFTTVLSRTPLSNQPAAQSSSDPFRPLCLTPTPRHFYSASDPTSYNSPSGVPPSNRPPPPLPIATSFESRGSTLVDSPLERIPELPYEHHEDLSVKTLDPDKEYIYTTKMEPARLHPPMVGGSKGRAMQQARDMEALVAERAKRGGEEPPPYDFYELIGKGAYGRVYKGWVS